MKQNDQTIAMAELDQWTSCEVVREGRLSEMIIGCPPPLQGAHTPSKFPVPNYFLDLSAVRRVEERFNNSYDAEKHAGWLIEIVLRFPVLPGEITLNKWSIQRVARATAEQRIEAILRTANLWK